MDSGQVFGFKKLHQNVYEGIIEGVMAKFRQTGSSLYFNLHSQNLVPEKISAYFDLERDLSPVYGFLSMDPKLSPLLKLKGLRIIKQAPWETIGTFIISSNNNIKRIQGIWQNLAANIGKGKNTFPSAEDLASSSENFLRKLGLGYRAEYLKKTAERVATESSLLDKIEKAGYIEAKNILMEFPGVGGKIADCILLFGYQRFEAFPVDIWIQRVISDLYFHGKKISNEEILKLACEKWGNWAGYVQQYIYHGGRTGILSA